MALVEAEPAPLATPLTSELISGLALSANASTAPLELMGTVMEAVCKATGWSAANGLACVHNEGEIFLESCGIDFALDEAARTLLREACADAIHWPSTDLPGRLLLDHSTPFQAGTGTTRDTKRQIAMSGAGALSTVAVPIVSNGDLIAAMEFFLPTSEDVCSETLSRLAYLGDLIGAVFVRDVREQVLRWDAYHDALTGLPNKILFTSHLAESFAAPRRSASGGPSVVCIALNGFKLINDGMGREFGDALLVEISERLRRIADEYAAVERVLMHHPETIMVARSGGAEFLMEVECEGADEAAIALAWAIHESLQTPFRVRTSTRRLTACIGIAHSDQRHRDANDLLRDTDAALARARECGGEATIVFNEAMREAAARALRFESSIRSAVDNHELDLAYQPIMGLEPRRLVGVEALLRWPQADGSIVMPDSFVPFAEQCDAIETMGSWVIRHACANLREMKKSTGCADLFVSVNLSPRQLLAPPFAKDVGEILADTGIAPNELTLEITESAALIDPKEAARVLSILREFGVRIFLDDFGSGFSSLSYLQTLPLDGLKIDRAFVRDQSDGASNWSIVEAILRMGEALNLDVVAEGIETTEQMNTLTAMGCPFGQGYLFSKPVAIDALPSFKADELAAA